MFDVGFAELMLLFVIGLLVLGPQRLPKVAAQIGKWIGRARRTATELRRQLEREIELAEQAEKILAEPPKAPTPPVDPSAHSTSEALAATASVMGGTPADIAAAQAAAEVAAAQAHAAAPEPVGAHLPAATAAPPAAATSPAPDPAATAPVPAAVEPPHGR